MSGQMNENLTQQFANFVQKNAPQNAEAILTDTSSPEIAAQREQLAREFVKQQVEPKVDEAYQRAEETLAQICHQFLKVKEAVQYMRTTTLTVIVSMR